MRQVVWCSTEYASVDQQPPARVVAILQVADANAGIYAVGNQIDETIIEDQFQMQVRIECHEFRQQRSDAALPVEVGEGDAQGTARAIRVIRQGCIRLVDPRQKLPTLA